MANEKGKKVPREHSRGGISTRDDATDLGVPMLAGDPSEPQGPEDALGPGPKRGDYRNRLGGSDYQPHVTVAIPEDEREKDSDGNIVGPNVKVVSQREHADEIGEKKGKKGGVNS